MFPKSSHADTEEQLLGFIRNAGYRTPTLLQKTVLPATLLQRDLVVEAGPGEGRTGLFLISLLMQTGVSGEGTTGLIVTASADEVHKVLRQYRRFSARRLGRPHIVGLGIDDNQDQELKVLSGNPDIVAGTSERIIDHLRRKNIVLDGVRNVILVYPEGSVRAGFHKDVLFIQSKLPGKCQIQAYCLSLDAAPGPGSFLKRPLQLPKAEWGRVDEANGKEGREGKMAENTPERYVKVQMQIKSVLKMIKEEENPRELNELRRIFRKHTPFHLRAYFAAYLLKNSVGPADSTRDEFKTLFLSVGKNQKVYPKDLKQFFIERLGATDSDIGKVKILSNYSFVDIGAAFAQKAIDTLDATDFRGRKITVNYSRKKGE